MSFKKLVFLWVLLLTALCVHGAQFTLTWTDNSTNEAGFRIERAPGLNATSGFGEIATVGANVVTYVDAGLPNSTPYSYRLRAYNSAGNSGYSNTASGTTPPPAVNTAPTITSITNQTVYIGVTTSQGPITFTVGDAETAAASLIVGATSSNAGVLRNSDIVIGGSGASRTITLTPIANAPGTTTVTVTVSDGNLTTTITFTVTATYQVPVQPKGIKLTDG